MKKRNLIFNREKYYDINDIVKITGLSKGTLYAMKSTGKIPREYCLRQGGGTKLLFYKSAMDAWLEKRGIL
jgi:predicted DNA-binding transcriptional regulator AlpA